MKTTQKTNNYNRSSLVKRLLATSKSMKKTAEHMEYFAGFDEKFKLHSRELSGAAETVRNWAESCP